MAGEIIVKVFKLTKDTIEANEIRMFQADRNILNCFRSFKEKIDSLFGYFSECGPIIDFFCKGR